MSNSFNELNNDRNLTDVFKELQQKRAEYEFNNTHHIKNEIDNPTKNVFNNIPKKGITEYISSNKRNHFNNSYSLKQLKRESKRQARTSVRFFSYTKLSVIFIIIAVIVSIVLLSISYNFTAYGKEDETVETTVKSFETNQKTLDLNQIISTNIDNGTIKETVNEQRDIAFTTKYQSIDTLPKGEEQTAQEGINGKNQVIAVRTYKNGELTDENIVQTTVISEPVEKLVNIGTSEFLAKYQVHLGDLMYVVSATSLKATASDSSSTVAEIPETLDVKLIELSGDWCKVSYDSKEGFVKTNSLTSATVAPEMVEKARVKRILNGINIDMELNKKSGLAASDYKKMLSGNLADTNKIFENNYQAFYDVEQKYNINGVFLASLAIHESGWGTSQISKDKKNLFGYGAYDSDPYNGAFTFEDYKDGIEMVAKSLVKYYINPIGTVIHDNETATATYFNGPTLSGINTRYSTDPDWHTKVFNYMQLLYNRLNS